MKRAKNQTLDMAALEIDLAKRRRATSLLKISSADLADPDDKTAALNAIANPEQTEALIKLLVDVSTGLWRLSRSLTLPDATQPLDEIRRARRHLQSIIDTLAQGGIQIRDHTGEDVPQGGIYALTTVAYEPTPGLTGEQVVETIKPTIYFKGQMIQRGEVIIGTSATLSD